MRTTLTLLACLALSACVSASRTDYPGVIHTGPGVAAYGSDVASKGQLLSSGLIRVIANPSGAYLIHPANDVPPLNVQLAVVKSATGCEAKPNPSLNVGLKPNLGNENLMAKRFELKCPPNSPLR